MNRISLWLAQIDVKDSLVAGLQKTGTSRGGFTALFSAVGVVTLLILGWAVFIRKRPDDRSRRYTYRHSKDSSGEHSDNDRAPADEAESGKIRRKRRRRKHRPRNPTLAETGGLPPVRADGYLEDPP